MKLLWALALAALALAGRPGDAQAEPFFSLDRNNQLQINQAFVDSAILTCLQQNTLHSDRIAGCMDAMLARCTSEEPGYPLYRTRDLNCLAAAKRAWNDILRDTATRTLDQLTREDAAEAGQRSARPGRAAAFGPAQDAWTRYREAECALTASRFRLGSYTGLLAERCLVDKTIDRVIELRSYGQ